MQFMTILSYGCLKLQIGCKIVKKVCHMVEVNSCLYKLFSEVDEVAGLQ